MARDIQKLTPVKPPEGISPQEKADFYLHFEEQLPKKKQRQVRAWVRTIIQVIFFLFLPSAYSSAFNGVKYIFTQVGTGALVEWTPFVAILAVLLLYTILFGRFFCGYACAFGSLGDWLFSLQKYIAKKTGKKPKQLSRSTAKSLTGVKYVVLMAIVVLCFTGLYGKLTGWNPWDAFSMLHALNFRFGKHVVALVLLLVLCVGMAFEERFFCKFLCPMGAIFSLMPALPFFSLYRTRKDCLTNCSACTKVCPADIELPNSGTLSIRGECFQCGKCAGSCPKTNVHCGVSGKTETGKRRLKGNELWFVLLRAVILLGLFLWLGV